MLRAPRPAPPLSARAPTKSVNVSHPSLPGLTEKVDRVIDRLAHMIKAFHIDKRQGDAAMLFRGAYDVIDSSTGGSMDYDRIRGAGIPGSPPPPRFIFAAERIREAKKKLYARDYSIVTLIAGQDWTVARVAAELLRKEKPSDTEIKECNTLFRNALNELADMWLGTRSPREVGERMPRIHTWLARDAIPRSSMEAARGTVITVAPGRVAHATTRGVKMTGG